MSQRWTALYMLSFSTMAAAMVVVASWPLFAVPSSIGGWGRFFVGGGFMASCVYGISLAMRPGWTRRLFAGKRGGLRTESPSVRSLQGHHPDCGHFVGHTFEWRGRVLCAGCTGIAGGSATSLVLMGLYLALPVAWPAGVLQVALLLGLGLVGVKYLEAALPRGSLAARLGSNALFVVGFLLVVVGAMELSGSPVVGFLAVFVSFLFVDTRIQLSRWRHVKTCGDCREGCKVYVD